MSEREIVEKIMDKGIDAMLTALAMYCSKGHCDECSYLDRKHDTCNVVDYICEHEELTTLNRVPYGDRGFKEDPDPDRDWRDQDYGDL